MSEDNMQCECDCIHEGDIARHILNPEVFGVVIGFQGSLVGLRLATSLTLVWFHTFELRRVDDWRDGGSKQELPDNVVDFTKEVELRKAKAKGSA